MTATDRQRRWRQKRRQQGPTGPEPPLPAHHNTREGAERALGTYWRDGIMSEIVEPQVEQAGGYFYVTYICTFFDSNNSDMPTIQMVRNVVKEKLRQQAAEAAGRQQIYILRTSRPIQSD